MGYTATLAGMVLGPGGIATLLAMPIAGRLVTRVNAKALLVFGIVVSAYSTWLMSRFNLQADFNTIIWPRIVLGVGMGFLFIPLTTLTMSGIRKEEMGNATAIYNLLRNLGGSFGVAFVTTMLARGAQYHQTYLTANLSPFDRTYQISRQALEQVMTLKGVGTSAQGAADASIYGQLIRQATMMSYNDAFYLLSICMIAILPLVFLMRQGKVEGTPGMH
jgi:DHA2 family multidrug resistance protein